MIIARSLDEVRQERPSVVTVGTFDGVHLAHREIIREVVNRTKVREGRSVVVTFDPHPKEVVASKQGEVKLLSTIDERIVLLEELKIDLLFIIGFTYAFSRLTSREFYRKYLVDHVGVSEVVVGYDHMFGRDRKSGIEELVKIGQEFDFSVLAVHPYTVDGEPVSSTRIRKALSAGNVERARSLLGYPYALRGRVVAGDKRGRSLGYPTANIELESMKKAVPGRGVYVVGITIGSEEFFGMANIGVRPTVTDKGQEMVEVHILDFSRDLYGEGLTIRFHHKLRDEQKFGSLNELIAQLARDKEASLRYIGALVKQP